MVQRAIPRSRRSNINPLILASGPRAQRQLTLDLRLRQGTQADGTQRRFLDLVSSCGCEGSWSSLYEGPAGPRAMFSGWSKKVGGRKQDALQGTN